MAPLGPPGQFGPGAKLGSLSLKPGPWQHAGFGPLRGVPPGPHPPDQHGVLSGPPEFNRNRSFENESVDLEDDIDSGDYGRPGTPEPPRSPRDPSGQTFYQSAPPGMGAMQGMSFKRSKDRGAYDREVFYGPQGPSHGPLAHATGQGLLRNTVSGTILTSLLSCFI